MLERGDFLSLNFVKKEDYAGSYKGMRYMLHLEVLEDESKKLKISLWPEPFGMANTNPELIIANMFDFNEDGFQKGIDWMNEQYPEVITKIVKLL